MKQEKGIGGHHRGYKGRSDDWFTPRNIIEALGEFNLDPATHVNRPWDTARRHYTIEDDGLAQPWEGRTWMNPPYGPETGRWLEKLARHGNGITLTFARTETKMFFDWVWDCAHAVLFLQGRLHFYDLQGNRAKANAGGPSVLIAYGSGNALQLAGSGLAGKFIKLSPTKFPGRER